MTSRRPPSDTFTRFTSTTPHAMARPASTTSPFTSSRLTTDPSPAPSTTSSLSAGPSGETPQAKVARLRAAARLAKERGSATGVDRFLIHGRRWADNMHRLTTYALIAFSGISTVVAVYGVSSLIAHNRRQKRAWIEREMDRLHAAQQAFLRGEASAEQLHLLEQERAGEEMALAHKRQQERKREQSYWSQLKGIVGAKAVAGEMGQETSEERATREARRARRQRAGGDEGWIEGEVQPVAVASAAASSGIKGVGVDSKGRPVPEGTVEFVATKVEGEKEAIAPSNEGRGWLSWIRGGKS